MRPQLAAHVHLAPRTAHSQRNTHGFHAGNIHVANSLATRSSARTAGQSPAQPRWMPTLRRATARRFSPRQAFADRRLRRGPRPTGDPMKKLTAASAVGIAAIALSLGLAGCSSDTETEATTSPETATTTTQQPRRRRRRRRRRVPPTRSSTTSRTTTSSKPRSTAAIPAHPPSTCRSRPAGRMPARAPHNGRGARWSSPTPRRRKTRRPSLL